MLNEHVHAYGWVCMYVVICTGDMYMFAYICIAVNVGMHGICSHICVDECIYMGMCVFTYMHMCMGIFTCKCLCTWNNIFTALSIKIYKYSFFIKHGTCNALTLQLVGINIGIT